ncbi:MAG TPA: hypothetical protein ENH19_00040 [Actinobacteria bacterium]|nr:hypothetical protein [Actinomycetes bacterium]HEX21025.1 hypothetical protein [Actinomycetota bacterium]
MFNLLTNNEKGLTLIELIIGVGLMSLVLQGIYAFHYYETKSWDNTTRSIAARTAAQLAINRISRDIRGAQVISETAPAIEAADKNSIIFYADVDNDQQPERLHYYLSGTKLIRGIEESQTTKEPWVFNGVDDVKTTLVKDDRNSAAQPLFRYFSSMDVEDTNLPLSSARRSKVTLLKINLNVDKDPGKSPAPVQLETTVDLRNIK